MHLPDPPAPESVPATGDSTPLGMLALALFLAAGTGSLLLLLRGKRSRS